MTELQILNKVIKSKKMDILLDNNLTQEYFNTYDEEYSFILNHFNKYKVVPDIETVLNKFPSFDVVIVGESDDYLVSTLKEEYQYTKTVPIINKLADLLQVNSYDAYEYLQSVLPELSIRDNQIGKDIISQARSRFNEYLIKKENPSQSTIFTGFKELDAIIGGLSRGEEFLVILARTGIGKSWVLIKMLENAWKLGLRVGLIEPEMSYNKVGYRFDTLHGNISNTALLRGKELEYKSYIDKLVKNKTPFFVATPKDFERGVTTSKLRNFCKQNQLDVLGIDGISYLKDERGNRGDNKTTQLTNISEDLMDLSIELNIPIIAVVQSNRGGAEQNSTPQLENIRDSDGIAYNASLVLSLQQKVEGIEMSIIKNRNGILGKLLYAWDIDKGKFMYIPVSDNTTKEEIENQRRHFNDRYSVL